jgi:prefoldin subunit 5
MISRIGRWLFVAFIAASVLTALGERVAAAVTGLAVPDIRGTLEKESEALKETLRGLDAAIVQAKRALQDVEQLKTNPEAMDEIFDTFKQQIVSVLQGVGPNSELADAIYRAKIAASRLLAWYKRQPTDYPERDKFIAQLEMQLQKFDEQGQAIQLQYREAFQAMTRIAQNYSWYRQAVKTVQIAEAVSALQTVVDELSNLNGRLKNVADKIAPMGAGTMSASSQTVEQ